MKTVPFLCRYGKFFGVGAFVEASRLLTFAVILENRSALVANVVSLLFRIVVAFVLHAIITWPDRPGRFGIKFIKFSLNQGVTTVVKTVVFPFWLMVLPCPLHALSHLVLRIFSGTIIFEMFSRIISCEVLSAGTMDTAIYATLGFFLHNMISFAAREGSQEVE